RARRSLRYILRECCRDGKITKKQSIRIRELKRMARGQRWTTLRGVDQGRQLLGRRESPTLSIASTSVVAVKDCLSQRPIFRTWGSLPHQTGLAIEHSFVVPVHQADETLRSRDFLIP